MKRLLAVIGIAATAVAGTNAFAVGPVDTGTEAGTVISNVATATYNVGTTTGLTSASPASEFAVEEVIDVNVSGPVNQSVTSPQAVNVTAYTITNNGNGEEQFDIGIDQSSSDDFDVVPAGDPVPTSYLYIDDNDNGVFDANDTAVDPTSTGELTLAPGASKVVFVRVSVPSGVLDTNTADLTLAATSQTSGASTAGQGTVLVGQGTDNVNGTTIDAVVDTSVASATVTYTVTGVAVELTKTFTSAHPDFGAGIEVPGSIITYQIVVEVTGSGTAGTLVIDDAIAPSSTSNVEYIPGSLTLGGTPLTDTDTDSDVGSATLVGATIADGVNVQVQLGNVDGGDPSSTITFQVEIQ